MTHVDNIDLANRKNRIGKSKLQSELHRLNKEQRTDLRMLNNERQRFKSKYSRLDLYSEHRGTEPSDVILYETHNPGFCYRRNGDCRMPQSAITNTSLGFEEIHFLVFSDGEVDIDKVLCLHLLSAHKTETLTPPPRSQRAVSYIAKEQSPLERLIERSRKRGHEDKLIKLLPIYVLDVRQNSSKKGDNLIRDGRLAARVIINEKITQLIRSVMFALEKSNNDKLEELVRLSKNEVYLADLVCKPHMQTFIKTLHGLNIISSCESFHLTPPFRVIPTILEVNTSSGYLENLVRQIRKNIFKLPITSSWDNSQCAGSFAISADSEDGSLIQLTSTSWQKERELYSQSLDPTEILAKSSSKSDYVFRSNDIEPKKEAETGNILFAVSSNTLQEFNESENSNSEKNTYKYERKIRSVVPERTETDLVGVFQNTKKDPKPAKKEEICCENFSKMDFEKIANLLSQKANTASKKDMNDFLQNEEQENVIPRVEPKPIILEHKKYSIKQTTCPACAAKWKTPLPRPKTCTIRRCHASVDDEIIDQVYSGSAHVLSKMIDQELKNWSNYNSRSLQNSPKSSPRYQYSPRNSFDKSNLIEIIDLDDLDLAKIRQEIRENETKKKLCKFLGENRSYTSKVYQK